MINLKVGMYVTDLGDAYRSVYQIIRVGLASENWTLCRRIGDLQYGNRLVTGSDRGETYRKTPNLREWK
jgi:hypothetical protein